MSIVLGLNISSLNNFGKLGEQDVLTMGKALEKFDNSLRLECSLSSREVVILNSQKYERDTIQKVFDTEHYSAWKPIARHNLEMGGNRRVSFIAVYQTDFEEERRA